MQQIYKRAPIGVFPLVFFCKFAAYFQNVIP